MRSIPPRVVVVGLGLIGGSIARALQRVQPAPEVLGASNDPHELELARASGVLAGAAPDARELVHAGDLVIYATPVRVTVELLRAHRAALVDAVVTDTGSVKRPVVAAALEAGLADVFVGSHPMAGDHRTGFGVSRAELFDGARVWLTPMQATPAFDVVSSFWQELGAQPQTIEAVAHDHLMAWASHLPQMVASALGLTLSGAGVTPDTLGPGGRDMTRLAASSPSLWADILLQNADEVGPALSSMRDAIAEIAHAIEHNDAEALAHALEEAMRWSSGRSGGAQSG